MESNRDKIDVAIVGGGLAGLAAAAYLAKGGRSATVFEKADRVGGMSATDNRHEFYFNLGAHALYAGNAATQVLEELGVSFTGGSPRNLKAASRGKIFLLPVDTLSLLRTGLLDPASKWRAARLLLELQSLKPADVQSVTAQEWIDAHTSDESVRTMLQALVRTTLYTEAPERVSMGAVIDTLAYAQKGVKYVDSGWQTLVDGLREKATTAGARIVPGTRVESVECTSGAAEGVRLANGDLLEADAVIIAAPPGDASKLVRGNGHTVLQDWADHAVPVKAACLDVALRKLPSQENAVTAGIDTPFFLSVQSQFSRVAPEGAALVYSFKYLTPGESADPRAVEKELEDWLDLTQPGWQEQVIDRRYLPSLTVYNKLVTAKEGGFAGRPGPEVPGIDGLYVAGDWVGPVGMLSSASLWSARQAARHILTGSGIRTMEKVA